MAWDHGGDILARFPQPEPLDEGLSDEGLSDEYVSDKDVPDEDVSDEDVSDKEQPPPADQQPPPADQQPPPADQLPEGPAFRTRARKPNLSPTQELPPHRRIKK
jgi:hypothetical protein